MISQENFKEAGFQNCSPPRQETKPPPKSPQTDTAPKPSKEKRSVSKHKYSTKQKCIIAFLIVITVLTHFISWGCFVIELKLGFTISALSIIFGTILLAYLIKLYYEFHPERCQTHKTESFSYQNAQSAYSTFYQYPKVSFRSDMTGLEYEEFVSERLREEGFTKVKVTPGSGDHGADILADMPDGTSVAIQCKMYSKAVGQHAVQEAVSAKVYYGRERAMVITNSTFTTAAKDFAKNTETILKEHFT